MRDRHFADDGFKYSSFAYRIEAVRILMMILGHAQQHSTQYEDTTSHGCSAAIKTFMLSLPTPKQSTIERNSTDEMMECAIMTINLASIIHHTPQSGLLKVRSFDTVSLSALDTMGENWRIAKVVKEQLAGFAREVFVQPARGHAIQAMETIKEPLTLGHAAADDAWLSDFINDPAYALPEGQELGFQLLQ
ncbi:hypothetical protein LTR05_002076 [Lithohypha guttulata]|uniref:Uncharacterized protein n=1 Tax=Lithohypha guttulata TaxID=1690604 RepID=A0AAN7T1V0_9EURO|nr:hypothetical protein LTR05_002076 [Lithohypha guttulata]